MTGRRADEFPPKLVAHSVFLGVKLGKPALGVHGGSPQSMGLLLTTKGTVVWSLPNPAQLRPKPVSLGGDHVTLEDQESKGKMKLVGGRGAGGLPSLQFLRLPQAFSRQSHVP